jgi:hypothetical protein
MVSAAWQGSTLPAGVTFMKPLPQPPNAGLRALGRVVGDDHVDGEHAFQPLALDELDRLKRLLVGGNQRGAVEISPAVYCTWATSSRWAPKCR